MPSPRQFMIDTWSALSHKGPLRTMEAPDATLAPSWVGTKNQRRLDAYKVLDAYMENTVRMFLTEHEARRKQREYGDPELVVQTIRGAILGGTPGVQVDDADGEVPDEPTTEDVRDGGPSLEELTAEWQDKSTTIEAAVERQEWFDVQWEKEGAAAKVIGAEDNAVGLGDGVYWLTWSNTVGRVRVRRYNPGFYFPAYTDLDDEYPNRVHLAWEYEDDDGIAYVRRITHERVQLIAARALPYQDEPSAWTVLLTDATWRVDRMGTKKVNDLDLSKAVINANGDGVPLLQFDLGVDFIPVIHVPNTIARDEAEPWGKSALLRIAQILDDLSANDTDTAVSAALVASPPLTQDVNAPVTGELRSYGPGQILPGGVSLLDTSKSLDALLKMNDALLNRMSINRQLPGSVLGRVDQSEIKSGLHLLLTFGPFRQMIEDARLVRRPKYDLLLKMWQRLAIVGGQGINGASLPPGALPAGARPLPANLTFGSYLPNDLAGVKDMVVALVAAHIISKATALRLLEAAGLDIQDIEDELEQAQHEDYDGALALANALGSEDPAYELLGIEPPEEPPPPAPAAPPTFPPANTGTPTPPAPGTPGAGIPPAE